MGEQGLPDHGRGWNGRKLCQQLLRRSGHRRRMLWRRQGQSQIRRLLQFTPNNGWRLQLIVRRSLGNEMHSRCPLTRIRSDRLHVDDGSAPMIFDD